MIVAEWEDDGIQLTNEGTDVFWLSPSEARDLISRLEKLLEYEPDD